MPVLKGSLSSFRYFSRSLSTMFQNFQRPPPDPIFSITENYRKDTSPLKVNLGVGAYQDEFGQPWVLPVVKHVEQLMINDKSLNKEYLPVTGNPEFIRLCLEMMYGKDDPNLQQHYINGVQTLSGCGACRVVFEYLKKYQDISSVYVSSPTWALHHTLVKHAGFTSLKEYRYYNPKNKMLDFNGMIEDLKNADENSVVLLHGPGHNPTGVDMDKKQINELCSLFKDKKLIPFFDCAYLGFISGDVNEDTYMLRKFSSEGLEFFAGLSFAKNMGLYNERIGCLTWNFKDSEKSAIIKEQIRIIIRNSYSNPPAHGSRIVQFILSDEKLYKRWNAELNIMTNRILHMRETLYDKLTKLGTPGDWSHIITQRGLFSYTGLTPKQVEMITKQYSIYMTKTGRINLCGLTMLNVDYVAESMNKVIKATQE